MDKVDFSETRRPGNGEIGGGEYTYYWLSQSDGLIPISSRLQFSVVGDIVLDECALLMMLVKFKSPLISFWKVKNAEDYKFLSPVKRASSQDLV